MAKQQRVYPLSGVIALTLWLWLLFVAQSKPLQAAPLPQSADPIFVGAGDIADCSAPNDSATATLLDGIAGTVFTLGDNAYNSGSSSEYNDCYEPTWGRHFARTKPVPGNHEYNTAGAAGYYGYFGAAASPQESGCTSNCKGYYSYNLGAWHVVALNSELTGAAAATQLAWLRDDLAANPNTCTLAYWHRALFTSGIHQSDSNIGTLKPYWETLYHYGADVILNGHDHNYERFAPQKPNGQADPTRGIRQFVVGTGGAPLRALATIQPNSEARNSDTHGVLKLTLHPTSYTWQFMPIAGQSFSDIGTANCVTAGPTIPTPIGYWRMEGVIENSVLNSVVGNGDGLLVGSITAQNNPPDNNVGWINSATTKNSFSVHFDSAGEHIEVAANHVYSLSNEVTLAAWINLTDAVPDQKIVGKLWLQFAPIAAQGYLLGVQDGQLKAEIYDSAQQLVLAKGGTITATTWIHVAMSWKRGGQLIGYINGSQVVTATASANPIGNKCEAGKGGCNVIIGGAPWAPSVNTPNGNIDEVMIFNQALSPDAIAQLAQRTLIVADAGDSDATCAGNNCTLRSAILGANANPNGALRDRIHFALPAPAIIQPDTFLPVIRDAVVIDGATQPGASCSTWPPTIKVALDGSNAGAGVNGLLITGNNVLVRGLNVRNFSDKAIVLDGGADRLIECNLVGTDLIGTAAAPNGDGIWVQLGSRDQMVHNLSAGNRNRGIVGLGSNSLLIQGNFIGTNISGTATISNYDGIFLQNSSNGRVGGATKEARNLISGNSNLGIFLAYGGSNNTIQGNIIGTDLSGQVALGNQLAGILVFDSANNTIGGKNAGNLIAYHLGAGVVISNSNPLSATNNFIAENRIYRNTIIGIDLGTDVVTANDLGDVDDGPNRRQNFPVLSGAASSGNTTTISGTLNSQANTQYLIEFYSNAANDSCQGETFLGFAFVTTDGSGNANVSTTLSTNVPAGMKIAATASDMTTFETSEFSACVPVIVPPLVTPTVSLTPFQSTFNEGAGSATLTVRLSLSTSVPITVLYNTSFNPFPGPQDATPSSDYTPATNQPLVIPAGKISGTIAIPLLEDSLVEQNERFGVTIALPANSIALLDEAKSASVVTIADNDGANNSPPVAQAQTVNVQPGVARAITLVGVDSDNNPLTYAIVTQPQKGTLSGAAPTVTYTPNPGFVGADSFTFKVNDGTVDSATVTVTLVVGTPPVTGNNKLHLPLVVR